MRAILVIISALGAAFLLTSLLKSWQIRRAASRGWSSGKIENNYIFCGIVAVIVFAVGVWCLEWNSASPNLTYLPAMIENGTVIGGSFDQPEQ